MLEWTKTLGRPLVCTRVLGIIRGAGPGQFNSPRRVAVHGDEVFVTDYGNHRVQVLHRATGAPLRVLGTGRQGKGEGELNRPNGIAIAHTTAEVGGERRRARWTTCACMCASGVCST